MGISSMQVLALLLSAWLVITSGASHGPQCYDETEHHCKKIPKQEERKECHVEYDIVEDVTYIEECEYVVTTHCEEEHETVQHSSHVVGHDVQKFHEGHHHVGHHGHHHKREADEGHGHHSHSTGPKCHDKNDKQCHKVPKTETHKIPKHLCQTIVAPSTLRSARRSPPQLVKRHMRRSFTPLTLSVMIPM